MLVEKLKILSLCDSDKTSPLLPNNHHASVRFYSSIYLESSLTNLSKITSFPSCSSRRIIEVLLTLRVQVDSCRPADLSALTTILLGGTPAICRNRLLWIQAVKDHFDDVLFLSPVASCYSWFVRLLLR